MEFVKSETVKTGISNICRPIVGKDMKDFVLDFNSMEDNSEFNSVECNSDSNSS